jgi:hypothetical protein
LELRHWLTAATALSSSRPQPLVIVNDALHARRFSLARSFAATPLPSPIRSCDDSTALAFADDGTDNTTTTTTCRPVQSYEQTIRTMLGHTMSQKSRLGLTSTAALLRELQLHPTSRDFATVHVAGTNGKGSVVTKVARALSAAATLTTTSSASGDARRKPRVGVFTSPHISCYRERIAVDGELIPEECVRRLVPLVLDAADRLNVPVTFFEITTLLALLHFRRERCDFVVMEVGLGGRLDSTNVVSPLVTVVTSIDLGEFFSSFLLCVCVCVFLHIHCTRSIITCDATLTT